MTQADRLLAYLRANPGASSLEIVRDTLIINTTGRISDLRAKGHRIHSWRTESGIWRYAVLEAPVQQELAL